MAHGVVTFMDVEVRLKVPRAQAKVAKEAMDVSIHLRGHAINLHPVAGRKQNNFLQAPANFQPAAGASQRRGRYRQLLAKRDGRCLVTDPCDENFHAFFLLHPGSDSPGFLVMSFANEGLSGYPSIAKSFSFRAKLFLANRIRAAGTSA